MNATPRGGLARLLIFLAGLLGAIGIAAAAGASHLDAASIDGLALVALTQAPALLAAGLAGQERRRIEWPALVIGVGTVLFCAGMAASGRFPLPALIAPLGGVTVIAGWLGLALGAVWPKDHKR